MGSIWLQDFTGGLDARRLAETTPGGVLIQAVNGHITRGGEFEKRAAFVNFATVPSASRGLAYDRLGLVVFGSGSTPSMPSGIRYQRLQHPNGSTALSRVLSWDRFDGKIYAVGEFVDGSRYHFYDGLQVEDWFDGRARARFTVTGGKDDAPASTIRVRVNGVYIMNTVTWADSNAATAAAIADAINAYVSIPEYVATSSGADVNIIVQAPGKTPNGRGVAFLLANDFTVSPASGLKLAGGGGDYAPAVGAKTRFIVSAQSPVNALNTLKANNVSLIGSRVLSRTTNDATADAIAAAINSYSSVPEYTATAAGNLVTITAPVGDSANGRTLDLTTLGDFAFSNLTPFSGETGGTGATASFRVTAGTASRLLTLTTNGTNLIGSAILYDSTDQKFAKDIVTAINNRTDTTGYSAAVNSTDNNKVEVTAPADDGAAANGRTIAFTVQGQARVTNLTAFASGQTLVDVQLPGTYVRTIGAKMYAIADSNLHFSAIQDPTSWTTESVGAGFIDMSSYASGSEELQAVDTYQNNIAIFGKTAVQIWYVDPDPALNTRSQILNNTGTTCPRSVTQFSDNDLFYLDESGLRSLRARDATNSASTTDIGVPVDPLITARLKKMTTVQRQNVIGLIEPEDNRFWLIMGSDIFVFSFFSGAKVSAWTLYQTGFDVSDALVFNQRVYLRSGNTVYVYGGTGDTTIYDATAAVARIPYLNANDPTRVKQWQGIDLACSGEWRVRAYLKSQRFSTWDKAAEVSGSTFDSGRIPVNGASTHLSLSFETTGSGPARLGSAVLLYEGKASED